MPHLFTQLPFPKASLAILEVFITLTGVELDLSELAAQAEAMEQHLGELLAQAEAMEQHLGELLAQVEQAYGQQYPHEEEPFSPEPVEEERLDPADQQRIENLFAQAQEDRSKAFELKQLLDRLGIFKTYEDRFLDLFKKS